MQKGSVLGQGAGSGGGRHRVFVGDLCCRAGIRQTLGDDRIGLIDRRWNRGGHR